MTRREALAKATTTTTVAADGLLQPSQSRAFIRKIKDSDPFGQAIRQEIVRAPSGDINKLATNSRIIRAAAENADDGYRAEPTFPAVPYTTTKIRLPFEVTEDTYESNIEKEQLEQRLVQSFATQMGLDLDDLDVNGDTAAGAGPDQAFLQIHDGLLKLAANEAGVHRIDGSTINGGALSLAHFFAAKRALPNKHRARGNLRWLMSPGKAIDWVESLTARATSAGDSAIGSGGTLATHPLGIEIMEVPFFPDDRIMLTNPKNLVRTVFRQIRRRRVTGDTDWELATRDKRGYIFFIRSGFVIEDTDALVDLHTLDV